MSLPSLPPTPRTKGEKRNYLKGVLYQNTEAVKAYKCCLGNAGIFLKYIWNAEDHQLRQNLMNSGSMLATWSLTDAPTLIEWEENFANSLILWMSYTCDVASHNTFSISTSVIYFTVFTLTLTPLFSYSINYARNWMGRILKQVVLSMTFLTADT